MHKIILFFIFCLPIGLAAQMMDDSLAEDQKYLEDQFYAGFTYNFLFNLPNNVGQRNLSYGFQTGLIKDIPLSRKRNVGLGIGLGYGLNSYYTNIRASELNNDIFYEIPSDGTTTKRSKIETHLLDIPFEFRWRNSNATEYNFWRVYAGIKMSYLISAKSKFKGEATSGASIKDAFQNNDARKFQYGLTCNFGYHNVNVHVYYSLSGLFEEQVYLASEAFNLKPLQVGFIFYFL